MADNKRKNSCAEAQLMLGVRYVKGIGVDRDLSKAVEWFTKSIKLCDPRRSARLQSELWLKDLQGIGPDVKQESVSAEKHTMFEMGIACLKMTDGNQSTELALYWLKKAWNSSEMDAAAAIGSMYMTGVLDCGRDIKEAHKYISKSAKAYRLELNLNQLMPPQNCQTKEDTNAMKWYYKASGNKKSIEKGCISGLSCLGFLYHKGLGVPQNFDRARELYLDVLKYIDDRDSDANMYLGLLYSEGLGVEQNYEEAMRHFRRSAKSVNTYVYNIIGDAYRFGHGVEKNSQNALDWYMKGLEYGDKYSQLNIRELENSFEGSKTIIDQT